MRRRALLSPGFLYFALFTFFLYAPILLLIVFSFNDSRNLLFPLRGFTLRWYQELLGARELLDAVVNSLLLGVLASAVATALGTMAAIGIARFNFPGRRVFLATGRASTLCRPEPICRPEARKVNIGSPRRVIEVEPVVLPLPEVLPEPQREPEPEPAEPSP